MATRVNLQILAKQVRVIDDLGANLGIMATSEALILASEVEKDLIEISPTAIPPVCKIMEYGKFLYETKKATKPQKNPELKEFRFKINIDRHDLETKASQIKKLLEKGHPIRVVIRFFGRENAHKDAGYELINDLKALLTEYTFNDAKQEDKQIVTGIRPN
jgi:translation initiation factor IF-3